MKTIELTLDESRHYYTREAFNALRTNILFSGKDVKSILITSCMAHEGKSTISIEAARSLAEAGKRVLLIDADLRKSLYASRYTKASGLNGLSEYLSGQVELEQVLCHTQYPGLDLIFAGPFPPNPTELIGSDVFQSLIATQREQYDYILVDAPPLGMVIDAAVMASACDGTILVIDAGKVKYRMAQLVSEQLRKSGCRILGAVLNQTRKKKGTGSKYYGTYGGYGSYGAVEEKK